MLRWAVNGNSPERYDIHVEQASEHVVPWHRAITYAALTMGSYIGFSVVLLSLLIGNEMPKWLQFTLGAAIGLSGGVFTWADNWLMRNDHRLFPDKGSSA